MMQRLFVALALWLLAWGTAAADFNVSYSDMPAQYKVGDNLKFKYAIKNNTSKAATVDYVVFVQCQSRPMPLLLSRRLTIAPQATTVTEFSDGKILAIDETQDCLAFVKISSPAKVSVARPFKIIGLPKIEIGASSTGGNNCPQNPQLFINTSCSQESGKVFKRGSQVLLNQMINVGDAQSSAILIYPGGVSQSIVLPAVITADQVGAYQLKINAAKSGYRPMTYIYDFAVVDTRPKISVESLKAINSGAIIMDTYLPPKLF